MGLIDLEAPAGYVNPSVEEIRTLRNRMKLMDEDLIDILLAEIDRLRSQAEQTTRSSHCQCCGAYVWNCVCWGSYTSGANGTRYESCNPQKHGRKRYGG